MKLIKGCWPLPIRRNNVKIRKRFTYFLLLCAFNGVKLITFWDACIREEKIKIFYFLKWVGSTWYWHCSQNTGYCLRFFGLLKMTWENLDVIEKYNFLEKNGRRNLNYRLRYWIEIREITSYRNMDVKDNINIRICK